VAAVRRADEAFLTNTTWELRPVASVDGHPVGGGPVTRLMTRLFDEQVERRHYGESDRPDVEPEPEPEPDPDPDG
jgi:branched-chain amino acid aminotransferase